MKAEGHTVRKWQLTNDNKIDAAAVKVLAGELGVLEPTARLLYSRGYTNTVMAGSFIRKEDGIFYDPYLLKDMEKAVCRILTAKQNGEKVMIYGDYDVDGVTSVSTLYLYLRSIGINCQYHIPSRTGEGYGISVCAVDKIIDDGYTLMISVDTGITACAEIDYASSRGLDTVITDHHECHDEIPRAVAVINPKQSDCPYPFKELAGVGVVFKLITAIQMKFDDDALSTVCNGYSDLVATGTIADVMPLIDENRLIVAIGLKKMERDTRVGIRVLLEKAGVIQDDKSVRITSTTIGYTLAPRINAAGRLSEASIAVELMLSNDHEKASELAQILCEINAQRKDEENKIAVEADSMVDDDYDFEKNPVIVLAKENWHHGVIGIVASRVTDKYGLPAILISFDEDGMGKGSGRSVKGFNLVEALSACSDCLEKHGGHELAAGLSVTRDNFEEFKRRINEYAQTHFDHDPAGEDFPVDLVLEADDISLEQADELYLLEPYGTGNPSPYFAITDAEITEISGIGMNKHSRITLKKDNKLFTCVYFGVSPDACCFKRGAVADAAFSLEVNEFRRQRNVQLNLKSLFAPSSYRQIAEQQDQLYFEIANGAHYTIDDGIYPSRSEFASLYTYIKRTEKIKGARYDQAELINEIPVSGKNAIVKLRYMLDVFEEMKLLQVERKKSDLDVRYNIKMKFVRGKVNLDKSLILRNLKSKQDKM